VDLATFKSHALTIGTSFYEMNLDTRIALSIPGQKRCKHRGDQLRRCGDAQSSCLATLQGPRPIYYQIGISQKAPALLQQVSTF
jgi:hypothetical protein